MTTTGDGLTSTPDPPTDGARRSRRNVRRYLLIAITRVVLITVFCVAAYVLAPMGSRPNAAVDAELAVLLAIFAAVVAWEILAVTKSAYPRLRAAETVAVSVPLLILIFASAYFVTERIYPRSFSEPLTRFDAVYFSITVLATVGFGDITAVTQTARALVTVQMLADLLLIGLAAKVLFGAAQQRRQVLLTDSSQSHSRSPAIPTEKDPHP
jgi:voltage-gated potassium channel